jgi:hypothetical protein
MNRMPSAAAREFESHFLSCVVCAATVAKTLDFIESIRLSRVSEGNRELHSY